MANQTVFATTDTYRKGGVEIVGVEDPKHYAFCNMYEVAATSKPWERVCVAQNLEYTVEVVRAEGVSPWYACGHDETALCVQGNVETHFIDLAGTPAAPPADRLGAVRLDGQPSGPAMGHVRAGLGHMTLLPAGAAYQFRASGLAVLLIQTAKGSETVEKWAQICQT